MLNALRQLLALAATIDRNYTIGLTASQAGFQLSVQVERDLIEQAR